MLLLHFLLIDTRTVPTGPLLLALPIDIDLICCRLIYSILLQWLDFEGALRAIESEISNFICCHIHQITCTSFIGNFSIYRLSYGLILCKGNFIICIIVLDLDGSALTTEKGSLSVVELVYIGCFNRFKISLILLAFEDIDCRSVIFRLTIL